MKIAALGSVSLVDYPGFIAAVIFTQGCNFRCGYCHNPTLLNSDGPPQFIAETDVLEHLNRRQCILDGLVVTGGEPTLQPGLETFIQQVKEMGFRVKLDTNGTSPPVLERLITGKLLDYVAMDIKAPPERYPEICGQSVDLAAVRESIQLLRQATIPYEFRTTLAPGLGMEDLRQIIAWIGERSNFVLQRCRAVKNQHQISIKKNTGDLKIASEFRKQFSLFQLRGFP
jgi:pyruvate formate lyase activating enzyme